MAEIKHFKVVASLPSPLEPDSIYYVRVGQGYDQYVTNGVGVVVAYEPNSKLDLENKVDKESGKQLSDENFTLNEKNKLASLENYDDSAIQAELDNKVDKVAGKGLSTEDYSTEEKNKLSGVEAGAQVNSVTSVAGKTGAVTLNKADVGLSNVDNTSDSDKPVSTPQQEALDLKLDANANAVSASKLAAPRTISLSGDASGSTSFDGSTNATIVVQVADDSHNHVISNVDGLQTALDSKVDKQAGYGLSQENYTPAEKSKLSSLEGSKFKGEYVSLAALEAAQPSPEVGSYAYVDLGVGEVVSKYIWDSSDAEWVKQQGETAALTPAEIKTLYEGNPDTNAFTDSEKTKLSGIQAGATANATNAQLRDRATHTGVQPISSVSGLQTELDNKAEISYVDTQLDSKVDKTVSVVAGTGLSGGGTLSTSRTLNVQYGTTAGTAAQGNDSRLSNSREWTASVVSQAEAEAGTATTARKWTSQRVRQAILGWWNTSTFKSKLDGIEDGATKNATDAQLRARSSHTGTQAISTISGLQTALNAKVDKVTGMGLSQESFTAAEKDKLADIEAGAQVNVGTNLAMGGSGNSRTITSSTGNNVSVPVATTSAAGFMSTADKSKLNSLSNVNLIAGSNISLSGAYPDITISSTNTTYSEISEAEVTTGTASTARAISARRLKFAVDTHGLKIGTTSTTAKAGNWTPTWSEVSSKPATATRWPSWSEVSSKPTTFTPAAHNHSADEIISGVFAYARIPTIRHGDTDFANQALNTGSNVRHATVRTGGAVDDGTNSLQAVGGTRTDTLAAGGVQAAEESIDTAGNVQIRGEGQLKMGDFAIQYNAATKSLDFNFMGD